MVVTQRRITPWQDDTDKHSSLFCLGESWFGLAVQGKPISDLCHCRARNIITRKDAPLVPKEHSP